MRRTLLALLLLLNAGVLAAAAADDAWKQAYVPKGDGWKAIPQEFTFNNESEPETLDPAVMTGVLEGRLCMALFEGLVTNDPKTLQARPGCAERWELSPDGTVYTFHLRDGLAWSDGTPLTAADFVRSWIRVITPATAADYAYLMDHIVGAEAFHQGRSADASTVGVTAPDARTLVVRLVAPCPWFLDLCAFSTFQPVPAGPLARHGAAWARKELIGNGPFMLAGPDGWKPKQEIVMVRNPRYWDAAFVKLAKITAYPHDNAETAYKLYLDGKLHWVPLVPLPKLDEIRRRADYYAAPYLGTYFYRLNTTRPPLDDVHVRRALAYAIDRQAIAAQITRGGQIPAGSWCPAVAGYVPVAGPGLDIDRARRELAASAYGPGKKPLPPIELHFNTSEAHKAIAEAVAQQLKSALGVEVVLRNSEWKTYLTEQDKLEYMMSRSAWIGDYGDPDTYFTLFLGDSGNNKTGWRNQRYDDLVKAAQTELDTAKRWDLYHQAETILVEQDCPMVGVYTYVAQGLLDDRVMGLEHNIRDIHPWQYIWLQP
jgi:oligopeptide transport system substrate-binding protein